MSTGREPHTKAVLYSNLAACRLRQRKWKEAIEACDAACRLEPGYMKPLYRRAQARRNLKQFEESIADCQAALEAAQRLLAEAASGGLGGRAKEDAQAVVKEITKFGEATEREAQAHVEEKSREARETEGITLAELETNDKTKHTYCERSAWVERWGSTYRGCSG